MLKTARSNAISQSVTFSTLPTAGSGYTGQTRFVTDVGVGGTLFVCDGTSWRPMSSQVVVCRIPSRIYWGGATGGTATYSQTGTTVTVTTGGAHNFTAARHNGFEIYLTQSTGSLLTGWFSNFTYINATSFSVTSTVSQSTSGNLGTSISALTIATSASLPANLVAAGAYLIYDANVEMVNNANNKIFTFFINSAAVNANGTLTTFISTRFNTLLNFISTTKQISAAPGSGASFGAAANAVSQLAIDTSSPWTVSCKAQLANTGDHATYCGGYIALNTGV